MTQEQGAQPATGGRHRAGPLHLIRGLLGPLAACVVIASVVVFVAEWHRVVKRRHEAALRQQAPGTLPAPAPQEWRAALLPVGTPAPRFSLTDVRTGRRVSLGDHRGHRPVVVLLSSFG